MMKSFSKEDFGRRLREAREARGWSQQRVADEAGTSQATVDRVERGAVEWSRSQVALGRVLGIAADESGGEIREISSSRRLPASRPSSIPVYAAAEGGPGEMLVNKQPIDFMSRPDVLENVNDAYAVYIVGESMFPEYEPGDRAVIHPKLPAVAGTTCVFYTNDAADDRAAIKRLVKVTRDAWVVEQWNPPRKFELERSAWPICHRVVSRAMRI